MMAAPNSYMICTAPRSGSTLLCKMLAATGIAGHPRSLFYRPCLSDWMTRLKLEVPANSATQHARLERIMQAALVEGRGGTPVFGLRQQWPSFAFLCKTLARLHPTAKTDRDCIDRSFGPTRFIHLIRSDKLGQAVSYVKAQQTGLWHVAPDGSELERTAPPEAPVYDADRIKNCIASLTSYDLGWTAWFAQEGISPLRICYTDLSQAPGATLRRVLEHVGLDPDAAEGVKPEVRTMADATSRDWIARFRAEMRQS